MVDDDLLRPSLSGQRGSPALYNSIGFFVSAFFAGPMAAGVYGIANSHRLGRLRQDLPVVLAVVAAAFGLLWLASQQGWLAGFGQWLNEPPNRALQLALRAMALACFAAIYLRHRQYYRSAEIAGMPAIPGWTPALVAIVSGLIANYAFASWIQGHH